MNLWNKTKDRATNPITIASLKKWAKDADIDKYNQIMSKYPNYYISVDDLNDTFLLSKIVQKTLQSTLVLCKKNGICCVTIIYGGNKKSQHLTSSMKYESILITVMNNS